MEQKIIYVKMTKVWAQFQIDEIVRFGESKGRSRIELGMGHEVPKSEYDLQQKKRAAKKPITQTAKAKAEAEAKAKAEAEIAKEAEEKAEAAKNTKVETATNVPAGETADKPPLGKKHQKKVPKK